MDDIRIIILTIHRDNTVQINQEPVKRAELRARLEDIYATRAERYAEYRAEPDVSWQQFIELIDDTRPIVERFGWFTPAFEDEVRRQGCR